MKVRRDSLGIPIVNASEIERLAIHFLTTLVPHTMCAPLFTPLSEIATKLTERGLCTFSFDEDLGYNAKGHKFFGYFAPIRKHVAVDRELDSDDPRFAFTLAHELGHFYLHGKVSSKALQHPDGVIEDSSREIVTHRIEAGNHRSLLEWQANQFAAAILMPRATVTVALANVQRELGITRHLGTVWLDRQPQGQRDYRNTLVQLALLYRVSQSVVRVRLKDLGILIEDERYVPRRVALSLQSALEEMFLPESAS